MMKNHMTDIIVSSIMWLKIVGVKSINLNGFWYLHPTLLAKESWQQLCNI